MALSPQTTIKELLREYPFLLDFLVAYRPEYRKLANPVLRASMGTFATLEIVARMGDVPLDKLLADVQSEIDAHADDTPMEAQADRADEMRHEALGGLIRDLHAGIDLKVVKERFALLIENASPVEIAAMEQALVAEGMPEEEIKAMCDLHVQIFRESLDLQEKPRVPAGHPAHTLHRENEALADIARRIEHELDDVGDPPTVQGLQQVACLAEDLDKLAEIDKHYLRKEHELFPALEKNGVTAPPKVMWAIHDEVRAMLREVRGAFDEGDAETVVREGRKLVKTVLDMIYKEENVLFPMALEVLDEEDWLRIREGEAAIGYALVEPRGAWKAFAGGEKKERGAREGHVALETGLLTPDQIDLLLNRLPVDVTFVDENDVVKFYSEGTRIFPRSPGIIGRKVQNCHPKASVHVVQRILDAFRAGERDVAEFWIEKDERFIHIRYFAVRDPDGGYKGVVEVVQDATEVRGLTGERRLLDWE